MTAEPFVPNNSSREDNPGYALVVPTIVPNPPFLKVTVATATSSTSIRS